MTMICHRNKDTTQRKWKIKLRKCRTMERKISWRYVFKVLEQPKLTKEKEKDKKETKKNKNLASSSSISLEMQVGVLHTDMVNMFKQVSCRVKKQGVFFS